MTMTGLPLAVVFFLFFFLFLIHFQQPIHIGLCRQKFPHFLTGTPVLGVGFLFSSSSLAYSDCRSLTLAASSLPSHQRHFLPPDGAEFLAHVPPEIFGNNRPCDRQHRSRGSCIINDMGTQDGDLCHAFSPSP